MDATSLGRLCIEKGLITEKDLERCLGIQKTGETWRRLGEILLSEGLLTGTALANLLRIQQSMRDESRRGRSEAITEPPSSELGWLLSEARASGACALLVGAGRPPVFRHVGRLEVQSGPPLLADQVEAMLIDALPAEMVDRARAGSFHEGIAEVTGSGRVRATVYRESGGFAASLRPILPATAELGSLGVPPAARELVRGRSGLALVAGPALSGRTTTLAALLESINVAHACHIVTIERPSEILLEPKRGRISRFEPEEGANVTEAAESALRADADVIAFGSLDEPAAVLAALVAAEAGKLVLGVMTAPSASAAVSRLLDALPPRRAAAGRALFATCLRGVLAQRLLPSADAKGPEMASELLLATPVVATLVRENRLAQLAGAMATGRGEGMVSLDDSLVRLLRRGRVTFEAATAHAQDPARFTEALGGRRESVHAGD